MKKRNVINFNNAIEKIAENAYQRGDYETAFQKWMPLAKRGNAEAQHCIGHLYHYWHDIGKYTGTSSPLYNSDRGVTESIKEAFKWTKRAAEQGHSTAEWVLGLYYQLPYGNGITMDIKKSVRWYTRSAKQGNVHGQHSLGNLYLMGGKHATWLAPAKNYKKAVKWIRCAAEQGDDEAQKELSELYEKGQGVQQDNIIAFMWFDIAAKKGDFDAVQGCSRLKKVLTPSQLAQAQKMSKKCVKNNYKGC